MWLPTTAARVPETAVWPPETTVRVPETAVQPGHG